MEICWVSSIGKNEVSKCASKCASVPSGLGMNRVAQSFRKEYVTVERAMRNTHMHEQVTCNGELKARMDVKRLLSKFIR